MIRVDLRYYDLSDYEVANFAKVLAAFPNLKALDIKSLKMSDAGLMHLQSPPQLRKLSVEAPVTDSGLAHLKALRQLEELSLKGTKATDAGVQELQKALANVKADH